MHLGHDLLLVGDERCLVVDGERYTGSRARSGQTGQNVSKRKLPTDGKGELVSYESAQCDAVERKPVCVNHPEGPDDVAIAKREHCTEQKIHLRGSAKGDAVGDEIVDLPADKGEHEHLLEQRTECRHDAESHQTDPEQSSECTHVTTPLLGRLGGVEEKRIPPATMRKIMAIGDIRFHT